MLDKFIKKFYSTKLQPQIFSLFLITLILVVFGIVIYYKVAKQKPNKAPKGILLLAEQYVMGVDALYNETIGTKFKKPAPYIFSLFTLLILVNIFGFLGFESPSTTYAFTFTIAFISWVGIYVVGIIHHKWRFFKKYINPIEIIGQFAPLISLSFRLFGNMIGGATIIFLVYKFTGWIWASILPIFGNFNLLGALFASFFHLYFDLFGGVVQAFAFILLTMVYWSLETDVTEDAKIIEERIQNRKKRIQEGIKASRA